jgi:hypothetical protein
MYDMLGGYLTTARVLLQLGAPPDSAGLSQAVTRCVQDSNWVVREAAAECVACLFASRRRDSPASAASQSCPALKERGEGMDGGAGGLCGGPESFEAVKSVAKALFEEHSVFSHHVRRAPAHVAVSKKNSTLRLDGFHAILSRP